MLNKLFTLLCCIVVFFALSIGQTSAQNLSVTQNPVGDPVNIDGPDELVVIHYDGPWGNNSIGDGGVTFQGGARFTPDITGPLTGGELQFVQFHYSQAATGLTLIIYDAGTATAPGAVLLTQPLDLGTLTVGDWNEITLSTPVSITGNDIWVILEVEDATSANYPFGVDAGPADPDGDWVNDSGVWQHLVDFGLNYNWSIRGVVEDSPGGGGSVLFMDNFDSYTAGIQLACQNPTDWTTWSCTPCAGDDGLVSNAQSFSGPNSLVITSNIDQVKEIGELSSGKYSISFQAYIPSGAAGYFNTLSDFACNVGGYWAMEVYFDAGGAGRLLVDQTVNFAWVADAWFEVEVIVDLNSDAGELWIGGSMVHQWTWTLGASGGVGPLVLDANDFFGATTGDQMYVDDYTVTDLLFVPVELTSFAANVNSDGNVELNWTTATELNNQMFEIERRTEQSEFFRIGYVNGHGTTTEDQSYSYLDNTVETGTYFYRLKQLDFNGTYDYSDVVEVEVKGPLTYGLGQNYPNPFNPSTNIRYSILETGLVKLSVYNVVGEEVSVLVNGIVEAGFHEVTFDASSLPSGTYFYKMEAGSSIQMKKMILLK